MGAGPALLLWTSAQIFWGESGLQGFEDAQRWQHCSCADACGWPHLQGACDLQGSTSVPCHIHLTELREAGRNGVLVYVGEVWTLRPGEGRAPWLTAGEALWRVGRCLPQVLGAVSAVPHVPGPHTLSAWRLTAALLSCCYISLVARPCVLGST